MVHCPYVEKGLKNGPVIVFVAGFPDNETSGWGTVLPDELGKTNRLIFICLPGYSDSSNGAQDRKWGYTQEEVLIMMHDTVCALGLSNTKFVLIAHDWGAYYALLYTTQHPDAASKLILCDIGMVKPWTIPLASLPFLLFYQSYFAISYVITQIVSRLLGHWIFQLFGLFYQLGCPSGTDRVHVAQCKFTVSKCYPSYYLWKSVLTGAMLKQDFPKCPLLYMVSEVFHRLNSSLPVIVIPVLLFIIFPYIILYQYGTVKLVTFHDQQFLRRIDNTPGCKRVPLSAGHWFMLGEADATLKHVKAFLLDNFTAVHK